MEGCIFCKIVTGELPSFRIYEDESYVAILDIHPLTEGQSLVIPKKHTDSYVFDASDSEITNLVLTARKVAKLVEKGLEVKRLYLVFEGLDVNHLHAKLFTAPLGMGMGARADDAHLDRLAKRIKGASTR